MVDLLEKLERFHEIDYYLQAVEKIQKNDGVTLMLYYALKGIIASAFGKAEEMYACLNVHCTLLRKIRTSSL